MILYVPFTRDNAGDLGNLVDQWKINYSSTSNGAIHIIYHGDDFDFESDENSSVDESQIYICAHGLPDNYPMAVGNHIDLSKSDILSIEEVTNRFNQDFLPVSHQVSVIHLYCCGNASRNKEMATLFRKDLLREEMPVYCYSGSVSIPDMQGTLWSFSGAVATPVHNTVNVLSAPNISLEDEKSNRAYFRKEIIEKSYDDSHEKSGTIFLETIKLPEN